MQSNPGGKPDGAVYHGMIRYRAGNEMVCISMVLSSIVRETRWFGIILYAGMV